jgi:hypothetical protein
LLLLLLFMLVFMLCGSLSPQHSTFSSCSWRRQPPDM